MLNTKYLIGERQGQEIAQRNPEALGNAWFVERIKWVPNADAEMLALNADVFDPANEAVIDERYRSYATGIGQNRNGASISLKSYDPKKMVYTANNPTGTDLLAVFSEIYYEGVDHDWKVAIDGKPVEHIRVNYLLRAMKVPAGNSEIVFTFEPKSYMMGEQIDKVFSLIMLIGLGAALFMAFKQYNLEPTKENE
jgi:hypothetical protein